MTRVWVAISETSTVERCLTDLRTRGDLPPQTDRIFVVDARNVLRGTVPLQSLIVRPPSTALSELLTEDTVKFQPLDDVADAARAFERYDLVSAPVVDDRGKLIGRLAVDSVIDFVRYKSGLRELQHAGLNRDGRSLCVTLGERPQSVAMAGRQPGDGVRGVASHRPIRRHDSATGGTRRAHAGVSRSVGGNTGNQTMALVIRAFAMDRIQLSGTRRLLVKELTVGVLNGSVWGLVVGLAATLIYSSVALGAVMAAAVVLNLIVAALSGVAIPGGVCRPAGIIPGAPHHGTCLLTFVTDAMGFFLFLGLATASLLLLKPWWWLASFPFLSSMWLETGRRVS